MTHREGALKQALMRTIKERLPMFVSLAHGDAYAGVPDESHTGYGMTSWWEVKHGTPRFSSSGIQELMMQRLAVAGFARYLIFLEDKHGQNKRTLIVHPKDLHAMIPEAQTDGHDHLWVCEYLRQTHLGAESYRWSYR